MYQLYSMLFFPLSLPSCLSLSTIKTLICSLCTFLFSFSLKLWTNKQCPSVAVCVPLWLWLWWRRKRKRTHTKGWEPEASFANPYSAGPKRRRTIVPRHPSETTKMVGCQRLSILPKGSSLTAPIPFSPLFSESAFLPRNLTLLLLVRVCAFCFYIILIIVILLTILRIGVSVFWFFFPCEF